MQQFLASIQRISGKHLLFDTGVICASLYLSLYLRVGNEEFIDHIEALHFYLPIILVIRLASLIGFRCYSVMWRFVSAVDAVQLSKAVLLSLGLVVAVTFFGPEKYGRLPRSVYIIDALIVAAGLMGARLSKRARHEARTNRHLRDGRRTLIYGAGNNGRLLANRFKSDAGLGLQLVGFVDDDPEKQGLVIAGIPVLGMRQDLHMILQKFEVSQLIVALPNLPGDLLREIVQITHPFNIRPKITSNLTDETTSSKRSLDIYREIDLADLLNRPRRTMELKAVREMVRGKVVLVTGAGGSIGSELARQVMSHEPARLLLLDNSEFNLYEIDRQLRLSTHDTQRVVPLLVDLKDAQSLSHAVREYQPEVVFHAAAYKHVHLVESNPFPSILNNVYGTKLLLELCKEINVQTFVMVSTDKAVNPAGVMGSTKRACELLVTAAALETGRRYCSVRFGNVLGSSGSLIPLLQQQIADGGPVTITHADMTRYFMLIPEAVSLILKAATIARPGDVNVLRMGEPVRILDIASSLIILMGRTQNQVPIVFTGLRPGEKMFEELYIRGDELQTEDPDILTLPNGDSNLDESPEEIKSLYAQVGQMIELSYQGAKDAVRILNTLVKSNYVPSEPESPHPALRSNQNH